MKVEVSKEFILEAHKEACNDWKQRIEKEVPELFKDKFEIGKWYRGAHWLFCYVGGSCRDAEYYGFYQGEWGDSTNGCASFIGLTEATDKEVEEALIAEAKKRGFSLKEGLDIKGVRYKDTTTIDSSFVYEKNPNYLWIDENKNGYAVDIFKDGKWATIIDQPKEMTIEEIQKELGCKIKIVE